MASASTARAWAPRHFAASSSLSFGSAHATRSSSSSSSGESASALSALRPEFNSAPASAATPWTSHPSQPLPPSEIIPQAQHSISKGPDQAARLDFPPFPHPAHSTLPFVSTSVSAVPLRPRPTRSPPHATIAGPDQGSRLRRPLVGGGIRPSAPSASGLVSQTLEDDSPSAKDLARMLSVPLSTLGALAYPSRSRTESPPEGSLHPEGIGSSSLGPPAAAKLAVEPFKSSESILSARPSFPPRPSAPGRLSKPRRPSPLKSHLASPVPPPPLPPPAQSFHRAGRSSSLDQPSELAHAALAKAHALLAGLPVPPPATPVDKADGLSVPSSSAQVIEAAETALASSKEAALTPGAVSDLIKRLQQLRPASLEASSTAAAPSFSFSSTAPTPPSPPLLSSYLDTSASDSSLSPAPTPPKVNPPSPHPSPASSHNASASPPISSTSSPPAPTSMSAPSSAPLSPSTSSSPTPPESSSPRTESNPFDAFAKELASLEPLASPSRTPTSDRPISVLARAPGVDLMPEAKEQENTGPFDLYMDDRNRARRRTLARFGVTPPDVVIELTDKKAWKSPKTLIQESKALYFPNIAGHSLVQREIVHTTSLGSGKISLVSCLGTDTKTAHCKTYSDVAWTIFHREPSFELIQINFQTSLFRSFLTTYLRDSLARTLPHDQLSGYMVSNHDLRLDGEDGKLCQTSSLAGYVYLLDENLKIRWAASGAATPQDQHALLVNARVLLDRLEAKRKAERETEREREKVAMDEVRKALGLGGEDAVQGELVSRGTKSREEEEGEELDIQRRGKEEQEVTSLLALLKQGRQRSVAREAAAAFSKNPEDP